MFIDQLTLDYKPLLSIEISPVLEFSESARKLLSYVFELELKIHVLFWLLTPVIRIIIV